MYRPRNICLLMLAAAAVSLPALAQPPRPAKDWPQWRGPRRSNISADTGLLKEWPKEGPPLLWKAEGLGEGVASVAVTGGKVFTLGNRDDGEFVTAVNITDGKLAWRSRIGPVITLMMNELMRWLSQRTPTVDGDLLYAVTNNGELICLETATGKERWRKDYVKEFGAKQPSFGFCDYPLVDGDKLICTPGGEQANIVALDKKTGKVLWQSAAVKDASAAYWPLVVAEIDGVRQYINSLGLALVGVAADDGKLLWHRDYPPSIHGSAGTLIVRENLVFYGHSYQNTSCGVFKLSKDGANFKAEKVWTSRVESLVNWRGSPVLVGDYVYFYSNRNQLVCLDFGTGKPQWSTKVESLASPSLTYADGHLYLHSTTGNVSLVGVTPKEATLKSSFDAVMAKAPGGTSPVVVGGRLYVRSENQLLCYDVKDPNAPRSPRPIFVPTPQDVAEKMLELAKVTKDDIVYDLGCGDGRIVVTAAKEYGCKAVGIDIDAECVKMALDNVKDNKLEHLVQIKRQDLYQTDFSAASVVTLYLLPSVNVQLIPQLQKLKPGSRIVSHAFDMKGVKPDRVLKMASTEDQFERPLYLWTTPLQMEKSPPSAIPTK